MILFEGTLYGANGGNSGGYILALDFATGEVRWDGRAEREVPKGAVAFADGRIYYRTEDGEVLLIEPSPEKYLERGRFTQPDRTDKPAWAHPVIANGKLYLRDQGALFVYDIRAK
jgi:outer membrane protein assembly factor BamB